MPSCEQCGFYFSRRNTECDTCRDHGVGTYDPSDQIDTDHHGEPTVPRSPLSPGIAVRWIAAAPFVLIVSFLFLVYTDFFSSLGHVMIVLYLSVAFLIDARQIALHSPDWTPNLYIWASVSVVNIVTFGLLTFVLAPYYLHRRRQLVPSTVRLPHKRPN